VQPEEQFLSELILEVPHMMAQRGGSDRQLRRGAVEAQVASHRFERAQLHHVPVQRHDRQITDSYSGPGHRAQLSTVPMTTNLLVVIGSASAAQRGTHDWQSGFGGVLRGGEGERTVPVLSEAEVERHLDLGRLLDGLEEGFRQLERGAVQSPPRPEITIPGAGFSLAMSAWMPGMQICVKVVNVFEANLDISLPNHLAMITLYDRGPVRPLRDGRHVHHRYPDRGLGRAVDPSAQPNRLAGGTIVGAGVQAREHLRLLPMVRDFERINICSLEHEHARRLAGHSGWPGRVPTSGPRSPNRTSCVWPPTLPGR